MERKEAIFAGLKEYVSRVKRDFKGMISIAIVSVENGNILVYDSIDSNIDNKKSGVYQVGVIRSVATALDKFDDLKNKDINDIIISYDGQKHLLLLSESRKFLSHAIIEKNANSMLAKRLMARHIKEVTEEIVQKLGSRDFAQKIDISL